MNQQNTDKIQKLRQLARHGYLNLSEFFISLTQEECILYATYKEFYKKLDEDKSSQSFHSLASIIQQIENSKKLDDNEKSVCFEALRLKERWYESQYEKFLQEKATA